MKDLQKVENHPIMYHQSCTESYSYDCDAKTDDIVDCLGGVIIDKQSD